MSFDHLHTLIRAKKAPLAVSVDPRSGEDPVEFGLNVIDAVADIFPAVILCPAFCLSLGREGFSALESLIGHAHDRGLFVILDAALGLPGAAGEAAARLCLETLNADCVTVNPYLGTDSVTTALEVARTLDKCLLVQLRTGNPSGGEFQDMVAGDRKLCQVVGERVARLDTEAPGKAGYGRIGGVVQPPFPSDLRAMRQRLEKTFFLVSGEAEDARFAFDKYGRGAIVDVTEAFWAAGGDDAAAQKLRDRFKQYITVL